MWDFMLGMLCLGCVVLVAMNWPPPPSSADGFACGVALALLVGRVAEGLGRWQGTRKAAQR